MTDVGVACRGGRDWRSGAGRVVRAPENAMTPEQSGWAILTATVIFGGELVVWFQGHLERSRRAFIRTVHRELRSCGCSGSADRSHPQHLSALAGVERGVIPHSAAAPPAPCNYQPTPSFANLGSSQHLAGAAAPRRAAPARPQRVAVHG